MSGAIVSPSNPRIKTLAGLKKRAARDASGRFLIEGHREIERAAAGGVAIEELLLCSDLAGANELRLAAELSRHMPQTEVGERAFARLSHRNHPDGLLAVASQFATDLDELALTGEPLLLIVESIEKPGNLGAMMRAADGAGADAIVVAEPATDIFNPNVIRASQGAVFAVPIATATATATVSWARRHGLRLFAGTPAATRPPWDADLTGSVAIVVGGEHGGVSDTFLEAATLITIPMAGTGDSLNTSMAAGVLLYEAIRQRSE